ncbi:hypothetical protein VHA01S_010_00540 [Vibrio halioticoli NBRC 102217]|uniref:Uncharacterized protein n=1 Tax=Vibrio halioticoli NBRC 102217 TaxID=1219072 RepID=V5FBV7_9VIBR|nr:hypothetical protein [Vibrio halioticoli]GAD88828.1 hypothetical protein VHA01S_010_00540 [Vibrio halioticoli NBRC 102217]
MTLANQYSISVRHQRSTRIDSDLSPKFFPGLVYHGTAQNALETLVRQYSQAGQSAYTLTGPYGSGKSTVALLLAGMLHFDKQVHNAARSVLNNESKSYFDSNFVVVKGWLQIRSVGGVNAPIDTFWNATLESLKEHPNTQPLFKEYSKTIPKSEAELITLWEKLFTEVRNFVDGVLILGDEMGKSLEFINKNKGELHLYQDLAEVLGRLDTPVLFLGLLHQSFSEYAKERGTKLQEEWAKIQGRYTDILYNVSTDETVSLIAKSIEPAKGTAPDQTRFIELVLNALEDTEQRKKQLKSRLENVAPLHPLVALILGPLSKRRFSQNERSTFGFLNSHEPSSFQLFLQHTVDTNIRYSLSDLWDYLETNLEHAILSSPDGHGWAEASEAINKVDVPQDTLNILKSIALLNLFGKPAKLYATEPMLQAASGIEDRNKLKRHLELLKKASSIIFRKHQSSWVIFEGSDIDIPTLLEEKIEQLTSSTEAIEHIAYSQQTMAKGHYHLTGSLRWVEQTLCQNVGMLNLSQLSLSKIGEFAHFVLLMEGVSSDELIKKSQEYPNIAFAVASNSDDIIAYANEVYALNLIRADKEVGAAIQHDKVAQKEFDSRLSDAQKLLWSSIEEGFSSSFWTVRGIPSDRAYPLSELASELADHIYCDSPKILNELVNRNKISGTAVSARKKLLEAMLDFDDEENLDIDGFPPEKSMYISCLKNTNLHINNGTDWEWSLENVAPEFKKLFEFTSKYLKDNAGEQVNLATIEKLWADAPFGISAGVFPILLLAYLKTLGQDIAYYEKALSGDFEFLAEPDIDYVHKLQKAPKELAIKFIVLEEKDKQWLQQLAVYVSILTGQSTQTNLLSIATPLVTTMHTLPHWVRNASNLVEDDRLLNKKVLRLRDIFLQANDPHALLIQQLNEVLDPNSDLTETNKIDGLEQCISVLRAAHGKMLSKMHSTVDQFIPESGELLLKMCQTVERKSGDLRLKSFARELGRSTESESGWLESLVAVVAGRGMTNWNESNLLVAEQKISDFSQDFLRVYKASSQRDLETEDTALSTRSVSLVLENEDGKFVNFSKEIKVSDDAIIAPIKSNLSKELDKLSEFEKIDVLKQLLQDALQTQG